MGSGPDAKKVRTWTDRSASFKVEAQFLGLKDGKIHLHKSNGVKIAVPVAKMAMEDIEYVEKVTGQSLDDEKPLSEIRRRSTQKQKGKPEPLKRGQPPPSAQQSGASIEQSKRPSPKPADPSRYDWFDFFLNAGVSPYQCERYAFNFNKDSMDESNLPDITPEVLRTLGLKEGDVLRVMKYLDSRLGRKKGGSSEGDRPLSPDTGGGLFSGPGGTLRNNTRKGRPAPAVQSNDVVDAESFKKKTGEKAPEDRSDSVFTPVASIPPPPISKTAGGFDDDAWDVKPSRPQPSVVSTSRAPSTQTPTANVAPPPALTGSMAELSLLSPPLEPTKVPQAAPQPPSQPQQTQSMQQPPPQIQQQAAQQPTQSQQPMGMQQQPTGANPGFFSQINHQQTGAQVQQQQTPQASPMPVYNSQPPQQQQSQQNMPPRQRPQAPSAPPQNSFLPPPPRPISAPQNAPQNNTFGPPPLQPQLTGFQPNHVQPAMAPSGQSLNELNQLNQLRQQQQQQFNQQQPMYPQPTGFGQQNQNLGQFGGGLQPQPTGFGQSFQNSPQPTNFQNQQPYINGQQTGSPFADPRPQQQMSGFRQMAPQPTGFQPQFQSSLQPQQTSSINSMLPPALQPQPTGMNGSMFGQPPPPMPPMPQQQPTLAPLQPQKTGPAPSVSFGTAAKKLAPQPTGRRANLSQASMSSLPCIASVSVH